MNTPTPTPATASPSSERSLWHNHDYVAWLLADTSWQFGSSIRVFAMLLVTYAVTGSYVQAGAVSTASTIASTVMMLTGGVLVDRWDRRTSLVVSGVARFLVYGAAAWSWWSATMTLTVIYAVGIAAGVIGGLFTTASNASLKSVVPAPELPRAVAVNQGRDAAVNLSASPVSGALMGISYSLPFLAAALGALLQMIGTGFIRADLRPTPATAQPGRDTPRRPRGGHAPRALLRELIAGFGIYRDIPILLRMLPAIVLINSGMMALFTGIQLILQGQGIPPWRIGLLDTAVGVGMLLGALAAPRLIKTIPTGKLCVTLFVGSAVVLMPLSFTQRLPMALTALTVLGLMLPALNGVLTGYFQSLIPTHLQGRALSTMQLVGQTVPNLMPALVGLGLQGLGAAPAMMATSVLFPAAALVVLTHRGLRSLPTPEKWDLGSTGAPAASPAPGATATATTVEV